ITRFGDRAQDALDEAARLLRRPAGALAVGVIERLYISPPVLGDFAGLYGVAVHAPGPAIGLFLHAVHETHVGATAARDPHGIGKERMRRGARVPQDRGVLAAEAASTLAADRVAPDDLVDEPFAAKQPIERDLDVVNRAVVEVDEQRAVLGE